MYLNEKQNAIAAKIRNGKNIYISGSGGVGKSYLLNYIKSKYSHDTIFMAPTGIAALNIGAATIHSVFRFPFGVLWNKDHSAIKDKTRDLFDKDGPVKRIVIDEISMVRADVLHAIDQQLRLIRRKNIPFGGLQVIVVGDFYQLPPVLTDKERPFFMHHFDSPYAFSGSAWSSAGFEWNELDEVMRQTDEEFIGHLSNIRKKTSNFRESIDFFNDVGMRNKESVEEMDPVYLCATNKAANVVNSINFEDIDEPERHFRGHLSGSFSSTPTNEHLVLKYSAKVMMVANTEDFMNGQIGYVTGFPGDKIEVLLEDDERTVLVEPFLWEEMDYGISSSGEIETFRVGSFKQYPLKLAWGSTIHKCQGQSLNSGIIDLGRGAFCHGQLYVALSRMKTLEGLGLMKPLRYNDVIVSPEVTEFYENDCKGIGLL